MDISLLGGGENTQTQQQNKQEATKLKSVGNLLATCVHHSSRLWTRRCNSAITSELWADYAEGTATFETYLGQRPGRRP